MVGQELGLRGMSKGEKKNRKKSDLFEGNLFDKIDDHVYLGGLILPYQV